MKVTCEIALTQISTMAAMLCRNSSISEEDAVKKAVTIFRLTRAHVERADEHGKYTGAVAKDDPGEYPADA